MNNATKKYLSALEARILKIEEIIQNLSMCISVASTSNYTCNQCGVYNPVQSGYVCSTANCCQGLNPADDVL